MKAVTHVAGIISVPTLNHGLNLREDSLTYSRIEALVRARGPIWVVCKGALFVMPWHHVKTEFERVENWYKVESPYIPFPKFNIKVNPKPLGNAELLTDLYAGTEDLDQTKPVKP
jgi:hypothetical protein